MSDPSPLPRPNDPAGQQPSASKLPAGSASNQAGERAAYKYLPIECPNCGFQGKVNISRLDQTFHCKQCNRVFHVTRDGTIAGERPPDAPTIDHLKPPVEEAPTWLERNFVKLPPWAKWAVLGVALLVLAYFGSKLLEPEEPLPNELEARVALAAKAFAADDWHTLKRLAKPGTARELGKWYDGNRPSEWSDVDPEQIESKLDKPPRKILKRYEKQTPILKAEATVDFSAPGQPTYTIPFFWDETETEEWWLDGEVMVKQSKPRKKTSTKATKETAEENEESAEQ